jgi:hypothetical protein
VICSQIRDTVDFDTLACSPSASASPAWMSRSDRPRTHPEITKLSNAFVFVTPRPNSRDENPSSVPRTFGRASSASPAVVVTLVA